MTVRNLICLFLYPSVVRWSADPLSTGYWLFSVSELICILVRLRWGQFCHQISHVSKHAHLSILFPGCSVASQHEGYESKYESWLYFLTKGMNWGLKALIPTYSRVVSIKSSVRLSNLKYHTFLWGVKGIRIAFQVYLLLEGMGGPEKD